MNDKDRRRREKARKILANKETMDALRKAGANVLIDCLRRDGDPNYVPCDEILECI